MSTIVLVKPIESDQLTPFDLEKDHFSSHDVLLCVQSGKNVHEENRMKYNTTELYLKNVDEMYKF